MNFRIFYFFYFAIANFGFGGSDNGFYQTRVVEV